MNSKNYIVEVKNSFTINKIKFSNWIHYDCTFYFDAEYALYARIRRKDGKQIDVDIIKFANKFKFVKTETIY